MLLMQALFLRSRAVVRSSPAFPSPSPSPSSFAATRFAPGSFSSCAPSGRGFSSIRLLARKVRVAATAAAPPGSARVLCTSTRAAMDQKGTDPVAKRADDDMMHEAYGEGYSTRSSEEGFGGIYSRPVAPKLKKGQGNVVDDDDDAQDINHSGQKATDEDFDHTQGSHVAEKERTRHGQSFTGHHHDAESK